MPQALAPVHAPFARCGAEPGSGLRRSILVRQTGRLTLCLGPENRWCAHVQRPHKSNGTYLSIDRHRQSFAQYCFDPDCRAGGFRGSDELPIPPELCVLAADELPPQPPVCTWSAADQFPEDDLEATFFLPALAHEWEPPGQQWVPEEQQWVPEEQPAPPEVELALLEELRLNDPLPSDQPQPVRQTQLRQQKLQLQPKPLLHAQPTTPSLGGKARDAMQWTPDGVGGKARDAMQWTPDGAAGLEIEGHRKENVCVNEVQRSRTVNEVQLKRVERLAADGGRTPPREDATPQRGREHPASTPSPAYTGTGSMQGVLGDRARWCVPEHEMLCGLFGSPLLDTLDPREGGSQGCSQGHADDEADEQLTHDHQPSAPLQQAGSMQDAPSIPWACAACTLLNASDATRCAVCDALKGSALASATTLALQRASQGAKAAPLERRTGAGAGGATGSRTTVRAPAGRTALQSSQRQTEITDFLRARR